MLVEIVVFLVLGLPFLASIIGVFYCFIQLNKEFLEAPWLISFFRLQLFFSRYLTDRGKKFRNWYFVCLGFSSLFGVCLAFAFYWLEGVARSKL